MRKEYDFSKGSKEPLRRGVLKSRSRSELTSPRSSTFARFRKARGSPINAHQPVLARLRGSAPQALLGVASLCLESQDRVSGIRRALAASRGHGHTRMTHAPNKIVATIARLARPASSRTAHPGGGQRLPLELLARQPPSKHLEVMNAAREIAGRLDLPLALLQDLSGPKIRVRRMKGDQPVELKDGATIRIGTDLSVEGRRSGSPATYEPLPRDLLPGTGCCSTTATWS